MWDPQHPDTPTPGTNTGTDTTHSGAPGEALSLEAVIERARTLRQHNADDIGRRLGRGERLTAEQLYNTLRTQTLATWWLLVDRHIQHACDDRTTGQIVARYVSWVSPYLEEDTVAPDVALSVHILGPDIEHKLALAHFDRALTLIRRDTARTFMAQAKNLVPACTEQTPARPTEQETTA
ncbi:hypothetical protein [Nonomuraea sp. NPDC023979]|uniref:hypothetical protein n=1 Tax=Nonomuraea sp. NPDC023979 TaxID=3154796 RepID=UPI0033EDE858